VSAAAVLVVVAAAAVLVAVDEGGHAAAAVVAAAAMLDLRHDELVRHDAKAAAPALVWQAAVERAQSRLAAPGPAWIESSWRKVRRPGRPTVLQLVRYGSKKGKLLKIVRMVQ
jgi:hypothetical protein